jgi:hypothetical protein
VQFYFFHESVDCSGPRYWITAGNSVESLFAYSAKIYSSRLFYASGPLVDRTLRSLERVSEGADPSQPGTCELITSQVYRTGDAVTQFDLSALGLVPPFTFVR